MSLHAAAQGTFRPMLAIGVDGYKKGWVAVRLADRRFDGALARPTLAEILRAWADAVVVGVDIPIHPPEAGPRAADAAARAFLKGSASSVFSTPPRAALEADGWQAANAISKERSGVGLSKQSYALVPRILEVDALVGSDDRIIEVHPEVSFRALAGAPLKGTKKSWAGVAQRRALLAAAGIELPDDLGEANPVPIDDVLDAAVAAWSASRYARGVARRLPEESSERGVIWY